jgi:hypothetical protein
MTEILNLNGDAITKETAEKVTVPVQENQKLNGIFYGRIWGWHLQIINMQRGDDLLLQEPHNQKFIADFYQRYGQRIKTIEETLNALREECCEKKNNQFVYVADANGNREALYKSDELKKKYEDSVNELFSRPANL